MTDIRSASVTSNTWRPFLAASPHGELCLTCYSSDSAWLYRLVGDTWHGEPYPFMNQSLVGSVAYDTAGRLRTAFSSGAWDFWAGNETDSGWTAGLVARLPNTDYADANAACFTVANDCSPWCYAYILWSYTLHPWGEQAALMHFSGDSWERVWAQGGMSVQVPLPLALVPHGGGVGSVLGRNWLGGVVLLCDSETVDSAGPTSVAGLAYTTEDIPLVAWVPESSSAQPAFTFKTDRWRDGGIPGPAGTGGIDIETSADSQVVIVYSTPDSGLWCARGTDVVGVSEGPKPHATRRKLGPTVLTGSSVQSLESNVLFDAMGRRVQNPRSGVFFIQERSAFGGERSAIPVRKVVIQR